MTDYKLVYIKILNVCSIYHWLPLEFCFNFLKYFEIWILNV
jgi:hypothetical protein